MKNSFNILYVGDVMARPGRDVIGAKLPSLRKKYHADFVIAQAENVSHGKSMTPEHMRQLQSAGIDFFTGGNHTLERKSLHSLLADPQQPVICPANMAGAPLEWGAKTAHTPKGNVLVMSFLGAIVPSPLPMSNPLRAADELLSRYDASTFAAVVMNLHGDYSSEKKIFGHYMDGRASFVVGDHWHVQTADAEILPRGTAYQTDVGMCGTLHSSLGIVYGPLLTRWRDEQRASAIIAEEPPFQLNATLVSINPATRQAISIQTIREIYQKLT